MNNLEKRIIASAGATILFLGASVLHKPEKVIGDTEIEIQNLNTKTSSSQKQIEEGDNLRFTIKSDKGGRYDIYIDGEIGETGAYGVYFTPEKTISIEGTTEELYLDKGQHSITVYKDLDKNNPAIQSFEVKEQTQP